MTCENCIHYDVCEALEVGNGLAKVHPIHCGYFKDKSRYIELPCKVGDEIFFLHESDEGEPYCIYEGVVQSLSVHSDDIYIYALYKNGLTFWHTVGDGFGFLTREEAEKALAERSNR